MYCLRLFIVVLQLFTTMFSKITVIIVVYSLKSMCIPSFVLIGCCMSELHCHLCPIIMFCLRLFIVVLQELHCLPLHVFYDQTYTFVGCYHVTKFRYSTPSGF